MSAEPVPLRLVDEHGEIVGEHDPTACLNCKRLNEAVQALEDQLAGSEKENRAWRARYAALERDQEKEARKDPAWHKIEELFEEWKTHCGHPRSEFTPDRFQLAKPIYKRKGYDLCLLAIQGAGFDPFTKIQKNGKTKKFDDWKLIFRDEDTWENFVNRAPAEALAAYKAKQEADKPDE